MSSDIIIYQTEDGKTRLEVLEEAATCKDFLQVQQEGSRRAEHNWIEKLHGFLTLNDRDLLSHAGKISHELAIAKAEKEYDNYQAKRLADESTKDGEFEKAIKNFPKSKKK
ncbi:MAG TPA: hypothetical protein DCO83_07155 [Mucilaginibacter sp.]|jgi:hypothetical protein|nr:hypothetical protein [Mucilaginibacter sp.]